jgi:hypothetical protein
MGFLQLATIAGAQQEPCTECGLGPHWIDQCATGQDDMPSGAVVGIDLNLDCVADVSMLLSGPATVTHSDPLDDSAQFPGSSTIDGHLDVIDTEMVSMNLIGSGVTLVAGADLGQGGVLAPSLGAIIEQQADPAIAESFFDIFFEVEFGGGTYAYNHVALRVVSTIDCLPPNTNYIYPAGCLPLFDSPVFGTGTHIANLITANLSTYPECGDPGTGDCFGPHETPFCNYSSCCQSVCDWEPDCCQNGWDEGCVDLAMQICRPRVYVSPDPLDLGTMVVGHTACGITTVSNHGMADLWIFTVTDPTSIDFDVTGDGCSGQALAPDDACDLQISFTPAAAVVHLAEFMIDSNDPYNPTYTVDLEGQGILPCAAGDEVTISGETLSVTETLEACQTLTIGPNVTITATADVVFRAGTRVIFVAPVTVESGASMRVEIDPLLSL